MSAPKLTRKRTLAATGGIVALVGGYLLTTHVLESHISPDQKYTVELSDRTKQFRYEVFSSLMPSGPFKKVGKQTTDAQDVRNGVLISSDSKRVVYVQQNTALALDRKLWSAPIDASNVGLEISQPMQQDGGVNPGFSLVRGGMFVYYEADVLVDERYAWYVVPVGGGEIVPAMFLDGFESGGFAAWSGLVR